MCKSSSLLSWRKNWWKVGKTEEQKPLPHSAREDTQRGFEAKFLLHKTQPVSLSSPSRGEQQNGLITFNIGLVRWGREKIPLSNINEQEGREKHTHWNGNFWRAILPRYLSIFSFLFLEKVLQSSLFSEDLKSTSSGAFRDCLSSSSNSLTGRSFLSLSWALLTKFLKRSAVCVRHTCILKRQRMKLILR